MADYIKKLCEKYHTDTTLLTKKEDRINALQLIPNLQMTDISPPPMTSLKLYGFHQLSYDDDIECSLSTFERLCISQKIPSDHWAVTLEAYLTRKTQKTFHILTDADKLCFVTIKSHIVHVQADTRSPLRKIMKRSFAIKWNLMDSSLR